MAIATAAAHRPARHRLVEAAVDHLGALMGLYAALEAERVGRVVDQAEQDAFAREAFAALKTEDRELLLVALTGRHVVGFLWARLDVLPYGDPLRAVRVVHTYVLPEHRRTRAVRDLFAAAQGWAKGLEAPLTFVVPFAKRTVDPWRRRGFTPRGVLMG